jgi:hypothetical protein
LSSGCADSRFLFYRMGQRITNDHLMLFFLRHSSRQTPRSGARSTAQHPREASDMDRPQLRLSLLAQVIHAFCLGNQRRHDDPQ